MKKMKLWFRNAVGVVGGSLMAGAAMAQASLPATITEKIDDTVDMIELAGWALFALILALLAFKYIRRVMK